MGHYDSAFDQDEDVRRQAAHDKKMRHHQKMLDKFDEFFPLSVAHKTPDRFIWAFEDYRRWLAEGLLEWERDKTWQTLKKET